MPWVLNAQRFECTLKMIGFNFEYIRFKIFEVLKRYLVNGLRCILVVMQKIMVTSIHPPSCLSMGHVGFQSQLS